MLRVVPFLLGGREALLSWVAARLADRFHEVVEVSPAAFDPESAFDRVRGQYSSRAILAQILEHHPQDRVIGLTAVDLFAPVLTFVFGEAQLGGRVGVMSIHRLRSELYGLPEDGRVLGARTVKEAVHELGHTYGLVHCSRTDCVMRSSTYVEEIDAKSDRFCRLCSRRVMSPTTA